MSNVLLLRTAKQREEGLLDDVLDAAERCIDEIGLAATSFELIAERTRLSCRSLLQRFEDKDALVRALLERNYMRPIRQMWLVERPADVHVVDFIAGLLEDWLLQQINIKRTRIDLELHLATLRDPVLAAFVRLQSASLIEHLSALLKRLLRGHTDTASSEHEFQARVFAVAAMCGGLHSVMTSGMELKRMHLQLILRESLSGILKSRRCNPETALPRDCRLRSRQLPVRIQSADDVDACSAARALAASKSWLTNWCASSPAPLAACHRSGGKRERSNVMRCIRSLANAIRSPSFMAGPGLSSSGVVTISTAASRHASVAPNSRARRPLCPGV